MAALFNNSNKRLILRYIKVARDRQTNIHADRLSDKQKDIHRETRDTVTEIETMRQRPRQQQRDQDIKAETVTVRSSLIKRIIRAYVRNEM